MQNKTLKIFYFIRFGVYIIYLNRLHMFWYCLMLVSKKISLMYIFDKLTWAAIGFLVYRITACWFGSASNFTLYMTMFSLNWTNRFPSPKRHLKPKDFNKVIKGQPYWACHLAQMGHVICNSRVKSFVKRWEEGEWVFITLCSWKNFSKCTEKRSFLWSFTCQKGQYSAVFQK